MAKKLATSRSHIVTATIIGRPPTKYFRRLAYVRPPGRVLNLAWIKITMNSCSNRGTRLNTYSSFQMLAGKKTFKGGSHENQHLSGLDKLRNLGRQPLAHQRFWHI